MPTDETDFTTLDLSSVEITTRDGRKVEIIKQNGREPWPIVGYIGDSHDPEWWKSNGGYGSSWDKAWDLILAPPKPETIKVYVYRSDVGGNLLATASTGGRIDSFTLIDIKTIVIDGRGLKENGEDK